MTAEGEGSAPYPHRSPDDIEGTEKRKRGKGARWVLTSFIAASSSALLSPSLRPLPLFVFEVRRCGAPGAAFILCNPAFSLSSSVHDKMVAKMESISNRLVSPREAARKERRMLVTSRLGTIISAALYVNCKTDRSTLVSDEVLRKRRSASVRCSLFTTAKHTLKTMLIEDKKGRPTVMSQFPDDGVLVLQLLLQPL